MQQAMVPGYSKGVVKWAVAMLLLMLVVFGYITYAVIQKELKIVVDGEITPITTFKQTVGDVLEERGIEIFPKDIVEPGLEQKVVQDMTINITRAFVVTVQVDGQQLEIITPPTKVEAILSEAGVVVDEKDIVEPELTADITTASTISVSRITEEFITNTVKVPFRVEKKDDPTLEKGIRRVVQKGKDGKKEETIKITYRDGKEVSRDVVKTKVISEPVSRIIANGIITVASRGGHRFEFEQVVEAVATAYTYTGNRTRTGTHPKVGTVAVDPSIIPLGSRLYVEGYGFARAEDTGGAIKGNIVDVFLETEREAVRWGRKRVKVYVLK